MIILRLKIASLSTYLSIIGTLDDVISSVVINQFVTNEIMSQRQRKKFPEFDTLPDRETTMLSLLLRLRFKGYRCEPGMYRFN